MRNLSLFAVFSKGIEFFLPWNSVCSDMVFASPRNRVLRRNRRRILRISASRVLYFIVRSRESCYFPAELWKSANVSEGSRSLVRSAAPAYRALFGTCHVGNPFFVCEITSNENFSDYSYRTVIKRGSAFTKPHSSFCIFTRSKKSCTEISKVTTYWYPRLELPS